MRGLMQEKQLLVTDIIEYAARWHSEQTVCSTKASKVRFRFLTLLHAVSLCVPTPSFDIMNPPTVLREAKSPSE